MFCDKQKKQERCINSEGAGPIQAVDDKEAETHNLRANMWRNSGTLWHQRYGHSSFQCLSSLMNGNHAWFTKNLGVVGYL